MPRIADVTADDADGGDDADGDDANAAGTATERLGVREAARVVRAQLLRPPVRSVLLGVAAFLGVVGAVDTYIQPVAVREVGFSAVALGPLYAGFSLVAAVASYNADRLERVLGTRGVLAGVPVVVGVALVAPAVVAPVLAMPAFVAMKAAREVVAPVASGYLNDHVDSLGRATVLSAAAMCYGTVRFALKPPGGVVADAYGPVIAVAGLGAFLVLAVAAASAVGARASDPDASEVDRDADDTADAEPVSR